MTTLIPIAYFILFAILTVSVVKCSPKHMKPKNMKTYPEILNETIEYYIRHEVPTQTSPEERAAKEYAKQWVEKVVVELSDSPRSNDMMIARLQKRIDAQ